MTKRARQVWPVAPATEAQRARLSLGLGAVVVVDTPAVVRTVLGSCVAVIFHVPRLRLSAVCHAQMPEHGRPGHHQDGCPKPCRSVDDLRYVTCCIRYMLKELQQRWVDKKEIVCTLVGGANVIRNLDTRWSVADRNVRSALRTLRHEGITVRYRDTGGTRGRVIEHICDLNQTQIRYHDGPS